MKIVHTYSSQEYAARLVWRESAGYHEVHATGTSENPDPFCFGIIEAAPQEVAALAPAGGPVLARAKS